MANKVEQLVVEKLTQYGIKATNGNMYSFSKFLKGGKTLNAGDAIEAEIYVGGKGGKYLNSFTKVSLADSELEVIGDTSAILLPPALPPTTLAETAAPGGEAPVKPAKRAEPNGTKGLGKVLEGKTDWAAKDKSIETQAVLKSVLESPAYAQLVVGKRKDEALAIGAEMFTFFLTKFYEARG